MDFKVLVEKLNAMDAVELGEYLIGVGAKGRLGCETTCVVAAHIASATGASVTVDTEEIVSWGETAVVPWGVLASVNTSRSMADFIEAFDAGAWPELVNAPAWS